MKDDIVKQYSDDPNENLVIHIIKSASEDYVKFYKKKVKLEEDTVYKYQQPSKYKRNLTKVNEELNSLEDFFNGDLIAIFFPNLDIKSFIEKLKMEALK